MASASDDESHVLLTDNLLLDGSRVSVDLLSRGFLQWRSSTSSGSISIEDDMIGYSLREEACLIILHCFVKRESYACFGSRSSYRRIRRDFVFKTKDWDSFLKWSGCIEDCFSALERPKRFLVLLNPFGGKKNAKRIFNEEVKPLLDIAQVSITLNETQFQRHAHEIVKTTALSDFDGIICVSGDGILVEVVNGLMERSDWKHAIKMPVGLIPAGTGNGMVKSLLDEADEACRPSNAAFVIIKGHRRSLDVATIIQGQSRFFSVLMLTWGLIADIDIESEKYRWMGSLRLDFYTFVRIWRLRYYSGTVYFIPASENEEYGQYVDFQERKGTEYSQANEERALDQSGMLSSFESGRWRFVKANFVMVWAVNVPWVSEDVKPAPNAKFSDGLLDLIIIKECSRWTLLNLLFKLDNGSHIKSEHVDYLKVKAFCLSPGGRVKGPTEGGIIDVDGEVVAKGQGAYAKNSFDIMSYGPSIQMKVEKGLATLFCP